MKTTQTAGRFGAWIAGCSIFFLSLTLPSVAQDANGKIGDQFIPADAMATALLSPAKAMSSPRLELLPTEIADAWFVEYIGVPVSKVDSFKVIVGPPGPNDALFAVVVSYNEDVPVELLAQVLGDEIEVDGHKCFEVMGPPDIVLHQLDKRTMILGSSGYLNNVIAAKDGGKNGPLSRFSLAAPHDGHVSVLLAVEPIRPLVMGALNAQMDMLPPPLLPFVEAPELLEAVLIRVDVEDAAEGIKLILVAQDEDSAKQLHEMITTGLAMAKQIALAEMMQDLQQDDDVISQAMIQYLNRMSNDVTTQLTPKLDGRRLTLTTTTNYWSISPFMVGSFMSLGSAMVKPLPSRPRVQAMNNMKMLGLAMHNHHDVYNQLPESAIKDADDKPLLSWRVKVLPFLDEIELYEQFRMDEPWDSEHNIQLLEAMPDVFRHPQIETEPGLTVYQAPYHKDAMFRPDQPTGFRNILDGTSNSVMIVETDAELATPWTKPADWEVDMDNALKGLHVNRDGTINLLFGDGSVRRFPVELGENTLQKLLTIAGGEIVEDF